MAWHGISDTNDTCCVVVFYRTQQSLLLARAEWGSSAGPGGDYVPNYPTPVSYLGPGGITPPRGGLPRAARGALRKFYSEVNPDAAVVSSFTKRGHHIRPASHLLRLPFLGWGWCGGARGGWGEAGGRGGRGSTHSAWLHPAERLFSSYLYHYDTESYWIDTESDCETMCNPQ